MSDPHYEKLKKRVERQAARIRKSENEHEPLISHTLYIGTLGLLFVVPIIIGDDMPTVLAWKLVPRQLGNAVRNGTIRLAALETVLESSHGPVLEEIREAVREPAR